MEMLTMMGSAIAIIGFVYAFLRNFKQDIRSDINKMENRLDRLEDHMFQLATGKSLSQAILEEKMKEKK
jgi:hypothetical protein